MATQSEDSLDTQAFARIKADLLASPSALAPTEAPRASRATASATRPQTRSSGNSHDTPYHLPTNPPDHAYGTPLQRPKQGLAPVSESALADNVTPEVSSKKKRAFRGDLIDEVTTVSYNSNAPRSSSHPKRTAMGGSERENGTGMSNGPNDTQELPSQVYVDYFNSEKPPRSPSHLLHHPTTEPSSPESSVQAYAAGDIGHVDLDVDAETQGQDKHQVDNSSQGEHPSVNHSEEGEDDNGSVTSPVAPSPITPAVIGQKRDRDGNVITFQTQSQLSADVPSQDLAAMFKVPQAKAGLGLSQVFNQTQAATSPLLEETRSDGIFERPSPDFRTVQRVFSPPFTSPELVRKNANEGAVQGPKNVYISIRQSQEKRRQEELARTGPSQESDDEGFGYLDQNSIENQLARRQRMAEIDAYTKKDFANLRTPSSAKQPTSRLPNRSSSDSLVTPAMRRKKNGVIEIPDDTPLGIVREAEDEDNEDDDISDAVSMDEYDEFSQAVISTVRRKSSSANEGKLRNQSPSSPLPEPDYTDNQPGTQQSSHRGTTVQPSSDAQGHRNEGWSKHMPSQSVKVADSQPDRTVRQDERGVMPSDREILSSTSAGPRQIIPQSQGIALYAPLESLGAPEAEIPETSSTSIQEKGHTGPNNERQQAAVSESPASSPPTKMNSGDHDNLELRISRKSKPSNQKHKHQISPPPPRRRRKPLRTIPDSSPSSTPRRGAHQPMINDQLEIPSASLPDIRAYRDGTSSRSLARSHSTSAYETARTNQSVPIEKSPLRVHQNDEQAEINLRPAHSEGLGQQYGDLDPDDGHDDGSDVSAEAPPQDRQGASGASSQENRPPQTRARKAKLRHQHPTNEPPRIVTAEPVPSMPRSSSGRALQPQPAELDGLPTDNADANTEDEPDAEAYQLNEPPVANIGSPVRVFPNRVFARFKDPKMLYYPATCLSPANESSFRIRFDDGIVDEDMAAHLVKSLELRPGDTVKVDRPALRKNEYIVRELCDRVNPGRVDAETSPATDIFGHGNVNIELKRRTSFSADALGNQPEMIQVPLMDVYLTQQLFTRLEGRIAPDITALDAAQRLHTPVDGPSRPATPSSRNRRQTIQMLKKPSLQDSRPVLGSRSGLFSNMIFAITHVLDKDFDEKKILSEKSFTAKLITENGGLLLPGGFEELFDTPNEDDGAHEVHPNGENRLRLSSKYSNSGFTALITNSHSRSPKFIQALALNIPCLSTRWIIDSVNTKVVLPWPHYLLPAGRSKLLGDAVRSRTFSENGTPAADTSANQLSRMLDRRLNLLAGDKVIMVIGKSKAEQDRRQTYVFLSHALGAERVKRVRDIPTAKDLLSKNPDAWTLLGVDEDSIDRARSALQTVPEGAPMAGSTTTGKRSRRRWTDGSPSSIKAQEPGKPIFVKVVGTEYLVQSLIVGRLVE